MELALAAVGYVAAFIATSELTASPRQALTNRLDPLSQQWWENAQATTWKPGHYSWIAASRVAALVIYLTSCRRCLSVEAVLVWSALTGWRGWNDTLAAAGAAVFAFEIAHRGEQ